MHLLAELSSSLATFSTDYPTVRVWSEKYFLRIISKAIANVRSRHVAPEHKTASSVLEWLENAGIAKRFSTELISATSKEATFYIVEMGAGSASDEPDPLEILQAFKPQGVICYFSAIGFHRLSTQPVVHNHVAVIAPSGVGPARAKMETTSAGPLPISTRDQLGREAFRFQEVPYYWTKRLAHTIPGVKMHVFGPKTMVRITDLEQTLLDTLHKPVNCGGAGVVHEAWDNGIGKIDESRMATYITQLSGSAKDHRLRRVGAMFDLFERKASGVLGDMLDDCRNRIENRQESRLSLLPGIPFPSVNPYWNLEVP